MKVKFSKETTISDLKIINEKEELRFVFFKAQDIKWQVLYYWEVEKDILYYRTKHLKNNLMRVGGKRITGHSAPQSFKPLKRKGVKKMTANLIDFTFSDLISGYVTEVPQDGIFSLKTSDDREFKINLSDNCYGEVIRNLGEPYQDAGDLSAQLQKGRMVFAYGIFYPENGKMNIDAKHLVFPGKNTDHYVFEEPKWWINQICQLGEFYLKHQFDGGVIDYSKYRTDLTLEGGKTGSIRQEADTISRLVYGFASAYMLSGDERFLYAAESGTKYLRQMFRRNDHSGKISYWNHAVDINPYGSVESILPSQFGDDYGSIPAYEQIYAITGPTQTYRITGDPLIIEDIQKTINLFDSYYIDSKLGGYFSHIDPQDFNPHAQSLGDNKSRKNWNSVGDHAPAYLINAVLATGNQEWMTMLTQCSDSIVDHFQDYENSPFVNEKFHSDWSPDHHWKWQQNRGVVGHNLKIAWNLTRLYCHTNKESYNEFAHTIATKMPQHGMDKQRMGWYDVVNRTLGDDEKFNRFAWHDRKAWWQQEQGILAYLIMAGVHKDTNYRRLARESNAFYNAWFPDSYAGGVYFNVLANGHPYLLGTERQKGSHSMSGYHSFELAYLGAVYTNLLITSNPLVLHFKPNPKLLPNGVLHVSPDMLPKGSVELTSVQVNGKSYQNFDGKKMIIRLTGNDRVKVRATITPMK